MALLAQAGCSTALDGNCAVAEEEEAGVVVVVVAAWLVVRT